MRFHTCGTTLVLLYAIKLQLQVAAGANTYAVCKQKSGVWDNRAKACFASHDEAARLCSQASGTWDKRSTNCLRGGTVTVPQTTTGVAAQTNTYAVCKQKSGVWDNRAKACFASHDEAARLCSQASGTWDKRSTNCNKVQPPDIMAQFAAPLTGFVQLNKVKGWQSAKVAALESCAAECAVRLACRAMQWRSADLSCGLLTIAGTATSISTDKKWHSAYRVYTKRAIKKWVWADCRDAYGVWEQEAKQCDLVGASTRKARQACIDSGGKWVGETAACVAYTYQLCTEAYGAFDGESKKCDLQDSEVRRLCTEPNKPLTAECAGLIVVTYTICREAFGRWDGGTKQCDLRDTARRQCLLEKKTWMSSSATCVAVSTAPAQKMQFKDCNAAFGAWDSNTRVCDYNNADAHRVCAQGNNTWSATASVCTGCRQPNTTHCMVQATKTSTCNKYGGVWRWPPASKASCAFTRVELLCRFNYGTWDATALLCDTAHADARKACRRAGRDWDGRAAACAARAAEAEKKPNIYLFVADDLRNDESGTGYAGNKFVSTPTIDAFAKSSVVFTRAYAASATCAPARGALFSGLYPMRNGLERNHGVVSESVTMAPAYFKDLNYSVLTCGKSHFAREDQKLDRPGNDVVDARWRMGFDTDCSTTASTDPETQRHTANLGNILHEQQYYDYAARDFQQSPYFVVVTSRNPHTPYLNAPNGFTPFSNFSTNLTVATANPLKKMPPALWRRAVKSFNNINALDREFRLFRDILRKQFGPARKAITIFTSDHGGWDFAKYTCYNDGLHVPFYVQHHGMDHLAPTRGVVTRMISMTDLLPTLLNLAGGAPMPMLDGRSFTPLLQNHKHPELHEYVYGFHNNRGVICIIEPYPIRSVTSADGWKYIRNFNAAVKFETRQGNTCDIEDYPNSTAVGMCRTSHLKANALTTMQQLSKFGGVATETAMYARMFYCRPEHELYDLNTDAHELNNLAASPANEEILATLQTALTRWLVQQNDTDPVGYARANLPVAYDKGGRKTCIRQEHTESPRCQATTTVAVTDAPTTAPATDAQPTIAPAVCGPPQFQKVADAGSWSAREMLKVTEQINLLSVEQCSARCLGMTGCTAFSISQSMKTCRFSKQGAGVGNKTTWENTHVPYKLVLPKKCPTSAPTSTQAPPTTPVTPAAGGACHGSRPLTWFTAPEAGFLDDPAVIMLPPSNISTVEQCAWACINTSACSVFQYTAMSEGPASKSVKSYKGVPFTNSPCQLRMGTHAEGTRPVSAFGDAHFDWDIYRMIDIHRTLPCGANHNAVSPEPAAATAATAATATTAVRCQGRMASSWFAFEMHGFIFGSHLHHTPPATNATLDGCARVCRRLEQCVSIMWNPTNGLCVPTGVRGSESTVYTSDLAHLQFQVHNLAPCAITQTSTAPAAPTHAPSAQASTAPAGGRADLDWFAPPQEGFMGGAYNLQASAISPRTLDECAVACVLSVPCAAMQWLPSTSACQLKNVAGSNTTVTAIRPWHRTYRVYNKLATNVNTILRPYHALYATPLVGFITGHHLPRVTHAKTMPREQCTHACSERADCLAFQWDSTSLACGLKTTAGTAATVSKDAAWHLAYSIYNKLGLWPPVVGGTTDTPPAIATATAPATTTLPAQSIMARYAAPLTGFMPMHALKDGSLPAMASMEECASACARGGACVAFQWRANDMQCGLKTVAGTDASVSKAVKWHLAYRVYNKLYTSTLPATTTERYVPRDACWRGGSILEQYATPGMTGFISDHTYTFNGQ